MSCAPKRYLSLTRANSPVLANPLSGKPFLYLIGAETPMGIDGAVTVIPYDDNCRKHPLKYGTAVGYCNLLCEHGEVPQFAPYLTKSGTAKDYDEGIPDPSGAGFDLNWKEQLHK